MAHARNRGNREKQKKTSAAATAIANRFPRQPTQLQRPQQQQDVNAVGVLSADWRMFAAVATVDVHSVLVSGGVSDALVAQPGMAASGT